MGLLHSRPYIIFKPKSMWQRVANVKTKKMYLLRINFYTNIQFFSI